MSNRKEFGKIKSVSFGIGGYQDCMIGLHVVLGGGSWGVADSRSTWDACRIKHSEHCKWTESDRDKNYAEIVRYVSQLLRDAKVDSVEKLIDIPVEVIFNGNLLESWRIFTEVL